MNKHYHIWQYERGDQQSAEELREHYVMDSGEIDEIVNAGPELVVLKRVPTIHYTYHTANYATKTEYKNVPTLVMRCKDDACEAAGQISFL